MQIQTCPHCRTRVAVTSEGLCPSCRQPVGTSPGGPQSAAGSSPFAESSSRDSQAPSPFAAGPTESADTPTAFPQVGRTPAGPTGWGDNPFAAEPHASSQYAPPKTETGNFDASNPYAVPTFVTEVKRSARNPRHQGLAWILLSFEGRIPRRVYWAASLGSTAVYYAAVFAIVAGLGEESELGTGLLLLLYIPMIWVTLAVAVKRWHDRDKSGWWVLIGLIPFIGPIWAFVETGCLRGTSWPACARSR